LIPQKRIGAFLCTCGDTLSSSVGVEELKSQVELLPGILFCHVHDALCQEEGRAFLKEQVQASYLEGILLAGCSPRGHGAIFERLIAQWGLNEQMLEVVDIREGCAWVHADQPDGATAKAQGLVRMGWAKLSMKGPWQDADLPLRKSALIVGGGPAGMAAALGLAQQGMKAHLVEKDNMLGGWLRRLSSLYPSGVKGADLLETMKRKMEQSPFISILLNHEVAAVKGNVGNFLVHLRARAECKTIKTGAVILAMGAQPFVPSGLFKYGEVQGVMTQEELESALLQGQEFSGTTVFIQCIGARIPERPYCSSICCPEALKNAGLIRTRWPQSKVFLLHRDVMAPGVDLERLYHQAMDSGVRFLRYTPDHLPSIEGTGSVRAVKVLDSLGGREMVLEADRVILSNPLVANPANAELAGMLSLSLDGYGFFAGRSLLEPNQMAIPGIYACGTSCWPCSVQEAITQGVAGAGSVLALLKAETAKASDFGAMEGVKGWPAVVKESACSGCGNCSQACPVKSIGLQPLNGRRVARVNKVRCTGCGTCATVCSGGAIQTPSLSDAMATKMIHEAFQ